MTLRMDADYIIQNAIKSVLPDEAVYKALKDHPFSNGNIYVVAIGKAAWQMAKATGDILKNRIKKGIVITKYNHVKGDIENIHCFEAGHPVPDENSFYATNKAIEMIQNLNPEDTVLFLVSGGGSALFEKPKICGSELQNITQQLLACGADIVEINTIRKRLSHVKGGQFATLCKPAKVFSIVLSDIIGDPLDMIASGPAYPDSSTWNQALSIIKKYNIQVSDKALSCLEEETPKKLNNVETIITGSVENLCLAAGNACEELGYKPIILTDQLNCEAKEAGSFLASIARSHQNERESVAYIAGGETIVHVHGKGLGGRNQELALSSAVGIANCIDTAIFSIGSDGTDGPTDAAGGYVDQNSYQVLQNQNINIYDGLHNNDAYHVLEKCNGLIKTGATGTNVNDVAVVLIKR